MDQTGERWAVEAGGGKGVEGCRSRARSGGGRDFMTSGVAGAGGATSGRQEEDGRRKKERDKRKVEDDMDH